MGVGSCVWRERDVLLECNDAMKVSSNRREIDLNSTENNLGIAYKSRTVSLLNSLGHVRQMLEHSNAVVHWLATVGIR